jgi:hypothetical protein
MSVTRLTVLSVVIASGWTGSAAAEHVDEAGGETVSVRGAADDDLFTPALQHAVTQGQAFATAVTQWNGAQHKTTEDLAAEVQVYGPLRLVLRVDNVFDVARPGVGGAVQWLDEAKHGVSSSAYFVYKAEGFTETEGELEGLVSFAKHVGAVHGTLNLAYGQDPEGRERDGEVALGLHIEALPGLFTGLVGRYRDALGSNGDKSTGILRDALGGGSATYVIGRVGVTATVGLAGIETTTSGSMHAGAQAGFAVGSVF